MHVYYLSASFKLAKRLITRSVLQQLHSAPSSCTRCVTQTPNKRLGLSFSSKQAVHRDLLHLSLVSLNVNAQLLARLLRERNYHSNS
jgi:hypothetical protein